MKRGPQKSLDLQKSDAQRIAVDQFARGENWLGRKKLGPHFAGPSRQVPFSQLMRQKIPGDSMNKNLAIVKGM